MTSSTPPRWLTALDTSSTIRNEYLHAQLMLPTGRLVACDPGTSLLDATAFEGTLSPGRYAVMVAQKDGDNLWARVVFRNAAVAQWVWAGRYGVDCGTGCFLDQATQLAVKQTHEQLSAKTMARLKELDVDPNRLDWHEIYRKERKQLHPAPEIEEQALAAKDTAAGDGNIVSFRAGAGDGVYHSWWGLDLASQRVCLLTDFAMMPDDPIESAPMRPPNTLPTAPAAGQAHAAAKRLVKHLVNAQALALSPGVHLDRVAEKVMVIIEDCGAVPARIVERLIDLDEVEDVFGSDDEIIALLSQL